MVKEIWEAVNPEGTSERNFKILVRAYNTFEDQPENRDFTREAVIGDLMGEKDLSDNPLKESIDIFTTDLEKALAILIYDIYITGENPQKVLGGKDPVQRYRPSDIDMVEVIRLLRKAESPFSQLTTDIGVALRELEVKFNESKEGTVSDRTDKISAEPEMLKDEIEKLAKSLESSLSKIKEGVLKAVQNKLLMVINNQQEYMSSVHSNILVELEDSEFIRRQ
jgi:soluble cytochrome b562